MKYEIVANRKPLALEKEVNARMNDGWLPQGGLAISDGDKVTFYCQAMIKHAEVKINVQASKKVNTISLREFLDSNPA